MLLLARRTLPPLLPLLLAAALAAPPAAPPTPVPAEPAPRGAACPAPPDRGELEAVLERGIAGIARTARYLYGARFRDSEIDYRVRVPDELEPEMRIATLVSATATDTRSGERVSGQGIVRADLAWRDCRWVVESIDVDY